MWTLDNIRTVLTDAVYRTVALRTIGVAGLVTVIDAVLALPIAFFMAKVAARRWQPLLVAAVLMPLWASYLVKAYAWRSMFGGGGLIDWLAGPFGASSPGYGLPATVCTLAYLWLPYMILPIFAGLERLPDSLLEAAGDLGARPWRTLRTVVFPLAFPAVVAGSIFTFSLSLGDYVAVQIVGGTRQFLGNLVYANIGAANNQPLAAAVGAGPGGRHGRVSLPRPAHRRAGEPLMYLTRGMRIALRVIVGVVLAAVYIPLVVVMINSFNADRTFGWPPSGFTLEWWRRAAHNAGAFDALWTSVLVGLVRHRRSRWCWARWPRCRCSATGSSAATRCRCW